MGLSISFDVDLGNVPRELARLEHPPVIELEGVLATTFAITQARVHVITGKLKASGHPDSEYFNDIWSGTLSYDGNPGIFELARGPRPSKHHKPPDTHFFFDPVEAPITGPWDSLEGEGAHMYEDVIMNWLEHLCVLTAVLTCPSTPGIHRSRWPGRYTMRTCSRTAGPATAAPRSRRSRRPGYGAPSAVRRHSALRW